MMQLAYEKQFGIDVPDLGKKLRFQYPRFCLSFIKFKIHLAGHRIPKVSNHNILLMVVIMSS